MPSTRHPKQLRLSTTQLWIEVVPSPTEPPPTPDDPQRNIKQRIPVFVCVSTFALKKKKKTIKQYYVRTAVGSVGFCEQPHLLRLRKKSAMPAPL